MLQLIASAGHEKCISSQSAAVPFLVASSSSLRSRASRGPISEPRVLARGRFACIWPLLPGVPSCIALSHYGRRLEIHSAPCTASEVAYKSTPRRQYGMTPKHQSFFVSSTTSIPQDGLAGFVVIHTSFNSITGGMMDKERGLHLRGRLCH